MENKETLIDYAQELPEKEALQKEIKRERYRRRFKRLLRSTVDALQKAVSIGCDYQGLIEVVGHCLL